MRGQAGVKKNRMHVHQVSAGAASGEWQPLTVFDLLTGHFYTEQALFFSQTLDGAALRASLARTLRSFPALAGRISPDKEGREGVLCSDVGVRFVEVAADHAMPAFGPAHPAKSGLRKYVETSYPIPVPALERRRSRPLLIVKLTQLKGGGSALGVAIDHTLADGWSAANFLRSWSQVHRGEPILAFSHERGRLDELGAEGAPGAAHHSDYFCVVSRWQKLAFFARLIGGAGQLEARIVRLPAGEVERLKAAVNAELAPSGGWASTSDAVNAYVWKRLAELRNRPADSIEIFGLLSDVRARLAPEVAANYFGNAVTNTRPSLPAGAVRSQSLGELSRRIRAARDENTRAKLCTEIAFLRACRESGRSGQVMPRLMRECFESSILLNDYSKLPFYEVDFGSGTPFWYDMAMGPVPFQVIVAPTPERDGGRDLHLCLPRNLPPFLLPSPHP